MRSLLPLLLLLALALGALLVFSELRTEAPAPPEAPHPTAAEAAPEAAPPPAAPAPAKEAAPGEAARAELPDPAPAAAATGPAPGEETLLVEVITDEDDSPVPGCVVYAVDTSEVDESAAQRLLAGSQDLLGVLRSLARSYRADEEGFARIRKPKGPLILAGEAPGLFHFAMFPTAPGMARLTLRLEAEVAVQVLVLDEAGRPRAGVPVVVRAAQAFFSMPVTHEVTASDGLATLRNFTAIAQFSDSMDYDYEVAVAAPLPEAVMAPLDLEVLSPEPIVLRLPATGSAVVEVLDLEGRPAADGTTVTLAEPEGENESQPRIEGMPQAGQASAVTVRGRASFPVVGLGLQLRASARLEGYPSAVTVEAAGPVRPGEEVRLRLQPERGPTWLTARLLDPQGQPLAEQQIQILLVSTAAGDRDVDYSTARTDRDGRFRYGMDPPSVDPGVRRTLKIASLGEGGRPFQITAAPRAELELAREYAPGVHDLGDIRLVPPPLLATGIVLAPDGRPVAGARVVFQVLKRGTPEEGWWSSDWESSAESDESGAFRLYGAPEDPENRPVRLEARKEGYRPGHAGFVPGQEGLTIRLDGAGRLRGSVLLDQGLEPSDLKVLFVEEREEGGSRSRYANWDKNEFYWDSLEPGTGRVDIRADGSDEPIHSVPDIQVIVGQENQDTRLQDIDLRGRLRHIRLEFVDERGRRVDQVVLTSLDPERRFWEYEWDGEMDLLVVEDLPPLLVSAEGYMSERLQDVREDRKVVLRQGAALEFLLDNPPALEEGWFLGLGLAPAEGEVHFSPSSVSFDASGRCVYRAPGAGVWEVHAYLGRRDGDSTSTWGWGRGLFQPETVTITDPHSPATFHLTVDAAQLAEYMEQAKD